jgi:acyl-CoA synthetase (AMP-forming)/AMP-acid ligase II
MAASEGTARKWFETTGCPMIEGWGMSETCAIGTNNPVMAKSFSGTIGLPLPEHRDGGQGRRRPLAARRPIRGDLHQAGRT